MYEWKLISVVTAGCVLHYCSISVYTHAFVSFARSLRYVDCRLCFGRGISRATIEADMNLFSSENTCYLPKETLEEDIHSSVTASSKQVLPPKENPTLTGGGFLLFALISYVLMK